MVENERHGYRLDIKTGSSARRWRRGGMCEIR